MSFMPKELEHKLMMRARKMGLGKERTGAYVYGTMNKLGMMKGNKAVKRKSKKRKK